MLPSTDGMSTLENHPESCRERGAVVVPALSEKVIIKDIFKKHITDSDRRFCELPSLSVLKYTLTLKYLSEGNS